jgi:hypothetical protein
MHLKVKMWKTNMKKKKTFLNTNKPIITSHSTFLNSFFMTFIINVDINSGYWTHTLKTQTKVLFLPSNNKFINFKGKARFSKEESSLMLHSQSLTMGIFWYSYKMIE